MTSTSFRRQVGAVRPSHLMYTSGVGALIDLPRLSVLMRGLDDWDYSGVVNNAPLTEDRLLAAVQAQRDPDLRQVTALKRAPWRQPTEGQGFDPADLVGVPVLVFPQWLRCTHCNELAPIGVTGGIWQFENDNPYRPDLAQFTHANCKKRGRKPMAVSARFVLACRAGHLDDFPYREFVHRGVGCEPGARLRMEDNAGNAGPNVTIRCLVCDLTRNMMEAAGRSGERNLPACRGRHPHLSTFDADGCAEQVRLLIVGASNQWFATTLSVLAIPPSGADELRIEVARHWATISDATSRETLAVMLRHVPELHTLRSRDVDEVLSAVETHRKEMETGEKAPAADLRTPEWNVFTADQPPPRSQDFALRQPGVDKSLRTLLADVVQAERLRMVRAFTGFTRIDAPDPDDLEAVRQAPISRGKPTWVPASEVRGEGIFLRLRESLVGPWEDQVITSHAIHAQREAYRRFRDNRNPGRDPNFDPNKSWPGPRYMALHTLSHLLIRRIAMECGYSSASLAERIYIGNEEEPQAGILLYTAAPDSEGTLGGLVALAEPPTLSRLVHGALEDARHCSSDPLCAERLPQGEEDFLHGAACHVCLFVSETTCERGNRFLDRRLVATLDEHEKIMLVPEGM
jgi:MrfA Zn-binding domain